MARAINDTEEDEEALQIGRLLGKADKSLLKNLDKISKQKNKKKSEIVKEALDLYQKLQMMEGLDSKTLFAGFMFWQEMMKSSVEFLASLSPIFSTNLVQSQLALLSQFMAQQQQQQAQAEEIEAPASNDPMKMTLEQMRMNLMQQLLNMIMNMMSNISLPSGNGGFNSQGAKTNLNQLLNQQKQTSSIPVEVVE